VLYVTLPLLLFLNKRTIVKVSAANHPLEVGSLARHGLPGRILARLARKVDRYVAISSEIKKGLLQDGVQEKAIIRLANLVALPPSGGRADKAYGWENKTVAVQRRLVPRKGVIRSSAWDIVSKEHRRSSHSWRRLAARTAGWRNGWTS
jgi:hypothetical protein